MPQAQAGVGAANALTMEMWSKHTADHGTDKHDSMTLAEYYDSQGNPRAVFALQTAPGRQWLRLFNFWLEVGAETLNDGRWHHIAASWDAQTGAVRLYVDGADATLAEARAGEYERNRVLPAAAHSALYLGHTKDGNSRYQVRSAHSACTVREALTLTAPLNTNGPTTAAPATR